MWVSSGGHAILDIVMFVDPSVGCSFGNILEFRAVSALLPLPTRPKPGIRV